MKKVIFSICLFTLLLGLVGCSKNESFNLNSDLACLTFEDAYEKGLITDEDLLKWEIEGYIYDNHINLNGYSLLEYRDIHDGSEHLECVLNDKLWFELSWKSENNYNLDISVALLDENREIIEVIDNPEKEINGVSIHNVQTETPLYRTRGREEGVLSRFLVLDLREISTDVESIILTVNCSESEQFVFTDLETFNILLRKDNIIIDNLGLIDFDDTNVSSLEICEFRRIGSDWDFTYRTYP